MESERTYKLGTNSPSILGVMSLNCKVDENTDPSAVGWCEIT